MRFLTNVLFGPRMVCGVFGSRTIATHLLRGAIAAGALAWALGSGSAHPTLGLGSVGVALLAMRGCPMCWVVGLVDTIGARMTR